MKSIKRGESGNHHPRYGEPARRGLLDALQERRFTVPAPVLLLLAATLSLGAAGCGRTNTVQLSTIETRVRELVELATYEQVYRDVGYIGEQKSFLFVKTLDKQLLYAVNIHVEAGVDLKSGVRAYRDPGNAARIIVEIPQSTILRVDADESTLHEYFSQARGGRVSWLEYADQIDRLKSQVADDAKKRGILERADENAVATISALLRSSGFEDAVVVTARRPSEPNDLTPVGQGAR